jgi:hypothetical protein
MIGEFKIEEKNLQCVERKLNPRGKIIIHTVKAISKGTLLGNVEGILWKRPNLFCCRLIWLQPSSSLGI